MSRLARTLPRAAALVVPALLLATPAVAQARTWTHRDARHDVQEIDLRGETTNTHGWKRADIRQLRVVHNADKVTATVTLGGYSTGAWTMLTKIKTPKTSYAVVVVHTTRGTTLELQYNRGRGTVRCDGLDLTVLRSQDSVRVRVPASCLHRPRWVQVGVGWTVPATDSSSVYADDALRTRDATAKDPALGKRLPR